MRNKIEYLYEQPTAVIDNEKTKIWYPDFWLNRYGMMIEYFGMMGEAGYARQCRHKMEVYRKNGIEGLFLIEASFKGDWPDQIIGQIEGILKHRLDLFSKRKGDSKRAAC